MRATPDFGTVRPVIRGQDCAVSSMKAQATAAAVEILDAGGNAFDAAVAGQAVLALVDPAMNGIGADALLLVYDAEAEQVYSINAEGMARALATIEWYEEHNNGELPRSDGLLAASTPGVVDAWYILLDRWGTMTFEQTLRRAIAVAAEAFPISEGVSRTIANSSKIRKYPTTMEVYMSDGRAPVPGEIFRNPDAARVLEKIVDVDPDEASLEFRPGSPERVHGASAADLGHPCVTFAGDADHEGDTSYIAVVDGDRNMVSFEPSLHSGFGTGVVVRDLGFSFTCRGDYYSLVHGEANALTPGKRPGRGGHAAKSTLVMQDGEPWGILGSPGGDDQIRRTMQTLLNTVEFDMNVQQAIEAGRLAASPPRRSRTPSIRATCRWSGAPRPRCARCSRRRATRCGSSRSGSMGSNAAIVVDHEQRRAGRRPRPAHGGGPLGEVMRGRTRQCCASAPYRKGRSRIGDTMMPNRFNGSRISLATRAAATKPPPVVLFVREAR